MHEQDKRTKAWIGDAVLALFAREWILAQPEISPEQRIAAFTHLTSNNFLSGFGEPTAVEAKIGIIYEEQGLAAAFDYITAEFLPLFKSQWRNKNKGAAPSKKRRR